MEPVCESTRCVSETNPDMVLDTNDWMLANINMKGFYRVNYDSDNWERLLARLNSNPQVQTVKDTTLSLFLQLNIKTNKKKTNPKISFQDIPLINRAQIINDAFTLARSGLLKDSGRMWRKSEASHFVCSFQGEGGEHYFGSEDNQVPG